PDPDGDGDDDAGPDDSHHSWGIAGGGPLAASRARGRARERFTPDAMQALRYAIARLAIDFVSGPAGITLDGADPDPDGDGGDDDAGPDDSHHSWGIAGGGARAASRARSRARQRFTPDAMQALRYAIARLAIDFVSGPAGLAGWLRTTLLAPPYNTPSLPLDIGYSDSIPASIRRAVLLRDRGCAWPRCGRPAAWCDVHHLQHKADGGKTAVSDCVLLCQFHHDICIHRRGWRLILHPDGTTTAYGPEGQVLHSHSPPTTRAG
ncbi:MAG: HNH endonuclease signature motif containing protein, partial [Trebonia sp.]